MVAPHDGSFVKVQRHGPAGTIVLNRPGEGNSLSREVIRQLDEALTDLHQQKEVRAVILTGAGDSFCTGADLHEMQATIRQDNAMALWHADAMQLAELAQRMLRFPKPMIAALNGPALGSGLALAASCDLVLASETATLGADEPRRGLVAGILAPLLNFRCGAGCTARLLLTSEPISAEAGLQTGLVHELVSDEQLWARAVQLAEQIAASAPEAIQLTKKLLNETIGETLLTQLSLGAAATASACTTAAAREGIQAAVEGRDPDWDNLDDDSYPV